MILHEFSHIFLGHLDYFYDSEQDVHKLWFEEIFEVDKITIRKVFEANADRYACKNLIDLFNLSLKTSTLSGDSIFHSKVSAYNFYACTIASIFRMLQNSARQEDDIYPRSNERMYIVISQLLAVLENEFPIGCDNFILNIMASTSLAGEELGVTNAENIRLAIENACKLKKIDKIIENIGLRKYQHRSDIF